MTRKLHERLEIPVECLVLTMTPCPSTAVTSEPSARLGLERRQAARAAWTRERYWCRFQSCDWPKSEMPMKPRTLMVLRSIDVTSMR
jgi:hypothetical protein